MNRAVLVVAAVVLALAVGSVDLAGVSVVDQECAAAGREPARARWLPSRLSSVAGLLVGQAHGAAWGWAVCPWALLDAARTAGTANTSARC